MNRPLCPDEKRILDALLCLEVPEAETIRRQARHARVVGSCDCGCGSVELEVDRAAAEPVALTGRWRRPEVSVFGENGRPIGGVILHLDDGYLGAMEIYSFGRRSLAEWPQDAALELVLADDEDDPPR